MTVPDTFAAAPLLTVEELCVAFPTIEGSFLATHNVSLSVNESEVLGLVGESGSGKSVTCRAVLGLVPPPGAVVAGKIQFRGRDLQTLSSRELRRVRAHELGVVFQDPFNSLNPVFTVGQQLVEVLCRNLGLRRRDARHRSVALLSRVGIPAPEKRMGAYAHELSGGMQQRVAIALALAPQPLLLIADEPTTALDVTIQDQILHLLLDIRRDTGMAMIIVSHDMGVIAQTCDKVAVMYGGHIVEVAPVLDLFAHPRHPYTRALLDAVPEIRLGAGTGPVAIPGQPPDLRSVSPGCPFTLRCSYARDACASVSMELMIRGQAHLTACPFIDASATARGCASEVTEA
jgi:oligopeptide/dipeptide ABC transporter ATP-binding protein